jgi:hypothetical protein
MTLNYLGCDYEKSSLAQSWRLLIKKNLVAWEEKGYEFH